MPRIFDLMYLKEYRLTFFVSKFHQPGSSSLDSTWLSRKNFLSATDHIFFGNEETAHLHHALILQHFETVTQDWSWMKHKLTNLWNYIKLSFILDHSRVAQTVQKTLQIWKCSFTIFHDLYRKFRCWEKVSFYFKYL